jgi:hypothetical protein
LNIELAVRTGEMSRRVDMASAEIAAYAQSAIACTVCKVPAGSPCSAKRMACKDRFVAALIELRAKAREDRATPEQKEALGNLPLSRGITPVKV